MFSFLMILSWSDQNGDDGDDGDDGDGMGKKLSG